MSMILYANVAFPGTSYIERKDPFLKDLKAFIQMLLTKNKNFRDSLDITNDLLKHPVFLSK